MSKNHSNPRSHPLLHSSQSLGNFLPSSHSLSGGISHYWPSFEIILASKYHLISTHTDQTKWIVPPPSSHTDEKTNLRSQLVVSCSSESASTGRILKSLCTNYTSPNWVNVKSLLYWNLLKHALPWTHSEKKVLKDKIVQDHLVLTVKTSLCVQIQYE